MVTATDSGIPPRSKTDPISIQVNDVNDNTPVLTVSVNPIEIYECAPGSQETVEGLVISLLEATDEDSGVFGEVSYLMSKNNIEGVDEFAINITSGEMTVYDCALLDYDKKNSYSFAVEARDFYREGILAGSLSATEIVTVTLKDLNDNAPILQDPGTATCFTSPLESLEMNAPIVTITGTDKDSEGPNKWMTFRLIEQRRIGNQLPNCSNLFKIETLADKSSGQVSVAVDDMYDCNGEYDITINACDQGDVFFGSQCSTNMTYRICVLDVNNNNPKFQFPDPNGSIIGVAENSTEDAIVLYDGENQLIFKATDADEGSNGQVRYTWKEPTDYFSLDDKSGIVTLSKKLDRTVQSSYNLIVVAKDLGTQSLSAEAKLTINVRLSEEHPSYFEINTQTLSFTENRLENKTFREAIHPDNLNLYPGESPYDFCYFAICGNTEYFEIPDKKISKLATKKTLDRENAPAISYVVIMTTNNCETQQSVRPCSEIDPTGKQYLNVSIQILDENDCHPEFTGSLAGGITSGNTNGDVVFPMEIKDPDENDAVTCKILDEFTVSDDSLANVAKPPFRLSATQQVILQFDVQSSMKGFFNLTVECQDKAQHISQSQITIYIVTDANKIDILFNDPLEEIESKRKIIEDIFTETLGYKCNVEKVTNYEDTTKMLYTNALSHFIGTSNEPVLFEEILAITANPIIESELIVRCNDSGLQLVNVGPIVTVTDNREAIFQILFIVACVAIVAMIAALVYLIIRRAELNRRVKALSSNQFGSQQSGMEKVGETAPNSNKFAVEGSNPIWSMDTSINSNHDNNFDNISESSGDSVLIGVEDNPEFRSYKPSGKANGYNHEVSSLPYQNVARRNPLVEDSSPPEPSYPPPPAPRAAKRAAPPPPVPTFTAEDHYEEVEDFGEMEDAMHSNFSFGKSMTEM